MDGIVHIYFGAVLGLLLVTTIESIVHAHQKKPHRSVGQLIFIAILWPWFLFDGLPKPDRRP